MNYSTFAAKALSILLCCASLLPLSALAVPTQDSTDTAIRLDRDPTPSSTTQSVGSTQSPVEVTPDKAEGTVTIVYQDGTGAETAADITAVSPDETVFAQVSTGGTTLRVRQGPGTTYPILCSVHNGTRFPITGETNGWYQVICNGRTGYISASYVVKTTQAQTGSIPEQDNTLAGQIVSYALQHLGYPYVYATAGPNTFDCSGLTSYVYKHFGYTLHRSSRDQLKDGVPVSKDNLQPADLVLFSRDGSVVSHVGIYIGDGQIIHASTATTGVIISDLNSNYYIEHYYAARRII